MKTRGESRIAAAFPALFWGSVWGLGEATFGHVLHLVRIPGLPGLIMLPFGIYAMSRVLARSRRADTVFLTGVVAAGFKFFDLLLPGVDPAAVVNPAQAILLESLAVTGYVSFSRIFGFSEWAAIESRSKGTL